MSHPHRKGKVLPGLKNYLRKRGTRRLSVLQQAGRKPKAKRKVVKKIAPLARIPRNQMPLPMFLRLRAMKSARVLMAERTVPARRG